MRLKSYIYVFAIFLTVKVSQNEVSGLNNIGLMVYNFTRLPTNETCDAGGDDCKYSMNLCFSYFQDTCSLFTLRTLTWVLRPGQSKIINIREYVSHAADNPLRVRLNRWTGQEVFLTADVWKQGTNVSFIEKLRISGNLPYPINDINKLLDNQIWDCGNHFCLRVGLYMWCDDINACVVKTPPPVISSSDVILNTSTLFNTRLYVSTSMAMDSRTSFYTSSLTLETSKYTQNEESFSSSEVYKISSVITPTETSYNSNRNIISTTNNVVLPPQARDSDQNVVKRWWFWVVLISAVLLALMVLMVILRHRKRKSRIIITTTKTAHTETVIENGALKETMF